MTRSNRTSGPGLALGVLVACGLAAGPAAARGPENLPAEWGTVRNLMDRPGSYLAGQLGSSKTPRAVRRAIPIAMALRGSVGEIPALVKAATGDSDARARESAVTALAFLGVLLRDLSDDLPGVGADELAAITDGLAAALKDKSSVIRGRAAEGLAAVGVAVTGTFDVLVDLMDETEAAVVQEAALALGHFHGRLAKAAEVLEPRLADKREAVRVSAAAALIRLGRRIDDSRAVLAQGLKSRDASAREAAVSALALFEGPGVIPGLWRALDDPEPGVRVAAAEALAEFGDAARVTTARLAKALRFDRYPAVRAAAAMALPEVAGEEAIPALAQALDQGRGEVGVWAGLALATLGRPGRVVLERASQSPGKLASRNAARALEFLGG